MINLYGAPISQPTRCVMWTLKLLNLPFTFYKIDAGKGEQKTPLFQKMNPNKTFPVIQIPSLNFTLYESNAICRYLCATSVSKGGKDSQFLYPSKIPEQSALVDQWLDWKNGTPIQGLGGMVRRQVLRHSVGPNHSMHVTFDEIKESREVRLFNESMDVLENHLEKNNFLTATTFTLADLAVFEIVEQLCFLPNKIQPPFGSEFQNLYPHVLKWQIRLRSIPFYDEVHSDFQKVVESFEKKR
jgi:glutathione S-transferase